MYTLAKQHEIGSRVGILVVVLAGGRLLSEPEETEAVLSCGVWPYLWIQPLLRRGEGDSESGLQGDTRRELD